MQNCLRIHCCKALILWFFGTEGERIFVVSLRKYKKELQCLSSGVWFFHTLAVDERWGSGNHKIGENWKLLLNRILPFIQQYLLNTNCKPDSALDS